MIFRESDPARRDSAFQRSPVLPVKIVDGCRTRLHSIDEDIGIEHVMRIIVDTALNQGEAEYLNYGDVAMLQVAVRRLLRLFPQADVEVITESAENLKKYCPGAIPLNRRGRNIWVGDSFALGRFREMLPPRMAAWLDDLTGLMERRTPVTLRVLVALRLCIRDDEEFKSDLMAFLRAVERAELVLVSGAGGFADSTVNYWDKQILGLLRMALRRGIPAVMVGQGMGPIHDQVALSRMKGILPSVDLITLRGTRGGDELIEALGVAPDRVMNTGDEAIELAYEARTETSGNGLGINLRVAPYAGVGDDLIGTIAPVLHDFARRHQAPMVPVPIALHQWAGDHETIRKIMAGYDDRSDGGASLGSPLEVIRNAGQCRIVVTGAYHAAVFALAQGIPVVCLAKSPYYVAKFLGLEDSFGGGCETIMLDDPDVSRKLATAMEHAWATADDVRTPLRQAAMRQIAASMSAYERIRDIVLHARRRA